MNHAQQVKNFVSAKWDDDIIPQLKRGVCLINSDYGAA